MNSGPFRWFWAARATKPCPDCGHKTSMGFDRNDPGGQDQEPSRCAHCISAAIDNMVQFARGEIGYPLTEQGPCVSCHAPVRRYEPQGRPGMRGLRRPLRRSPTRPPTWSTSTCAPSARRPPMARSIPAHAPRSPRR